MPHTDLESLVATCRWIGQQGWAPATGGNMSIRRDKQWCWISGSGKDKGALTADDFLQVNIQSGLALCEGTPSAETALHTLIYRLYPESKTVLHVHTVNATVLSRLEHGPSLKLQGYEMQKTLRGHSCHQNTVSLPIFDNNQDINALAEHIRHSAHTSPLDYGFLLRGHGLTCWGRSVSEARRHLEGLEFLFACELLYRRCQP